MISVGKKIAFPPSSQHRRKVIMLFVFAFDPPFPLAPLPSIAPLRRWVSIAHGIKSRYDVTSRKDIFPSIGIMNGTIHKLTMFESYLFPSPSTPHPRSVN
ncbi:hypothetical protein CDAR_205071 [Caerostris darwini]|uniref:Uncharacterized protein n=1 Tax=Caerostris darwini TaxID=1538125 RepID=A0AAV4PXV2_9ARAC|nr:hypothetical protein CDAR_205071 [Caerostris darwini]